MAYKLKKTIVCFVVVIIYITAIHKLNGKEPPNRRAPRKIHHVLCLYSCPTYSDDTNFLVNQEIYLLSANPTTKFADWVAYQVIPDNLGGGNHSRNWKKDPAIPADYTLTPKDYNGAYATFDYDRGHQAPLADFSNNPNWAKTNYLSNITPQKANLNRGAWAKLENKERTLAKKEKLVYVLTGPIYRQALPSLPNAQLAHIVPSSYWKIIAVDDNGDDLQVAGFYFRQDAPRNADFCEHTINISDIEHLTGLKFFDDNIPLEGHSLLTELGC